MQTKHFDDTMLVPCESLTGSAWMEECNAKMQALRVQAIQEASLWLMGCRHFNGEISSGILQDPEDATKIICRVTLIDYGLPHRNEMPAAVTTTRKRGRPRKDYSKPF